MSVPLMETPRCKARAKQTGERCKRRPIPGGTVCSVHGGGTRAAREAGARRLAEAQAAAFVEGLWRADAQPVTDPVAALAQLAGQMQHAVGVLGPMLDTNDLDGATASAFRALLKELRQSLEAMAKLGIAERHIELQQGQANIVVTAFRQVLEHLQLVPADRDQAVRLFLRGLGREVTVPGELE